MSGVLAVAILSAFLLLREEPDADVAAEQEGNRWSVPVNVTEYKFDTGSLNALPPGRAAFQVSVTGKEPHEFQIFRLADGVDLIRFQEVALRVGRDPKLFRLGTPVGGVGAGGGIPPGGSGRVVLDLELGRYVFISFVNDDHKQGMIRPFDVLQAESVPVGEPVTEGSITMTDGQFELPDSELAAGMYSVANEGTTVHEAAVFEVETTLEDLVQRLTDDDEAAGAAGFSLLDSGWAAYSELNLPAGRYAFVCRVTDPETGEPYFKQGMVQEFEIL